MNEEWIHLTDYGMQNCIILARFKQHWATILILFPTHLCVLRDLGTQTLGSSCQVEFPLEISPQMPHSQQSCSRTICPVLTYSKAARRSLTNDSQI